MNSAQPTGRRTGRKEELRSLIRMAERIFVSVDSCFANGQHTDGLSAFRNAGVWPSPERQSIGLGSRRRFPGAPIRVAEGVESEGRSPCVSRLTEEFNL